MTAHMHMHMHMDMDMCMDMCCFPNLPSNCNPHRVHAQVAFLALGRVNPVTHAVGNTIKRVVIIIASVSSRTAGGCTRPRRFPKPSGPLREAHSSPSCRIPARILTRTLTRILARTLTRILARTLTRILTLALTHTHTLTRIPTRIPTPCLLGRRFQDAHLH